MSVSGITTPERVEYGGRFCYVLSYFDHPNDDPIGDRRIYVALHRSRLRELLRVRFGPDLVWERVTETVWTANRPGKSASLLRLEKAVWIDD